MTAHASRLKSPLDWHKACWEIIDRARRADRLPHGLLVTGPAGIGKRQLVTLLAHSLLCSQPDARGLSCGHCRECELLAAGTHPDLAEIGPDADSKSDEIKVDAIRRLVDSDALTAHRGGRKIIILDPAQNMNLSAANSLLKTLEEPSPGTLLCLVCEQPSRLPATIRSRCQELNVPVPPAAEALEWLRGKTDGADAATLLRLAHGAPLRALTFAQAGRLLQRDETFTGFSEVASGDRDPITEAAAWNKHEPAILLDWLGAWVSDLLRLASGHPDPELTNPDKANVLRTLAVTLEPAAGHCYLQHILQARAYGGSSVNRVLLYESLLVEWAKLAGAPSRKLRQRG